MKTLSILLILCLAGTTTATWNGCGGTCRGNNQCDDALCSHCAGGKCISGSTCNSSCTVDSDCERLRYCYLCTGHVCSPGPRYPNKCGLCKHDNDCSPLAYCNRCIPQVDPITKKHIHSCGSGCNGLCQTDYDCGIGSKCSHCDQTLKRCQTAGKCGALCGSDSDCDQFNSPCKLCIDAVCSSNCNQACNTNFDCNAPVTGCGVCSLGKCTPGATCGTHCNYNLDCAQAGGGCTVCVDNKCSHVNCGTKCTASKNCLSGNCPACTQGKCTQPMCNSTCVTPEDCGAAGNCTGCTSGLCSYPTCGSLCNYDGECSLASFNCSVCSFGRCTAPQCGSHCINDNQCRRAGKCITCQDNQCVPPNLPGQCGIHRGCPNGNNNECPVLSCSHCDPFSLTCRIGFPCAGACIVSSDCNQLSSCTLCQDVCTDLFGFLKPLGLQHLAHNITDEHLEQLKKEQDEIRLNKFWENAKKEQMELQKQLKKDRRGVYVEENDIGEDIIDSLKKETNGWLKYKYQKAAKMSIIEDGR